MAKRASLGIRNNKSRSHKTKKRLEAKRVLLAGRKPARGSVRFRRSKRGK